MVKVVPARVLISASPRQPTVSGLLLVFSGFAHLM